jgi:tricorn protease
LAVAAPLHADTTPAPFLRRPDVHGDTVAFSSEGDLWTASLSTGESRRLTNAPGVETEPFFSPDGKTIAFSGQYDGGSDVYTIPLEGGLPKRLTFDPRGVRVIGWTPDGKNIVYSTRRQNSENNRRLWSVPAEGGAPKLLPIPQAALAAMAPDGRRVAYVPVSAEWQHWKHYRGGQADDVWIADLDARTYQRVTDDPGVDTTPTWAGDAVYFVSERGGLANLYRLDPVSRDVKAITHYTDAEVRYPGSDGHKVVFQHGRGLAIYDIAAGSVKELDLKLSTDLIHARSRRVAALPLLRSVAIGPTGKRVLAETRGQIVSAPVDEGDWRVVCSQPGTRSRYPSWSPDGKQIAFVSDRSGDEEVWIAPATGPGDARQLTKRHEGPLGPIVWSPDGTRIATGDREMRILLIDVKSGETTLVDQSDRGGSYDTTNFSYAFSPDGKYMAFNRQEPNWFQSVYLYEIATKRKEPVTDPEVNSYNPAFSTDGKYLFFLADREFDPQGSGPTQFFGFDKVTRVSMITLAKATKSPFLPIDAEEGKADEAKKDEPKKEEPKKEEPKAAEAAKPSRGASRKKDASKAAEKKPEETKKADDKAAPKLPDMTVDWDGLASRIIDVPVPADRYLRADAVEGRLLLYVGADPGEGEPSLKAFNLKETRKRDLTTIARCSDYDISGDRKKLLVRTGGQYVVIDASAGSVPGDAPKVDFGGIWLNVDPRAEWRQIFNESWRVGRDFFYDPNLHGVDWAAVKKRYEAVLPSVADRSELNEVLGDMIAELNAGHAYVGGGDAVGGGSQSPMGYLGADFEPDSGGKAYRVTHLLRGDGFDFANRSPLIAPGVDVNEGDYILAVAGQPVHTDEDIQALLIGTSGRIISLTVNSKPETEGSREVLVRPMGDETKARYYDWVNSRREYVRTHGGESFAYIHIPDMSENGLTEFAKHYYANNQVKDGIIYDVRYNGGGYISAMLLLQMASRPYVWFKPRYGASWTRQSFSFPGYSVALANENSFSNAEEFADGFQRLKIGPVVGVPTGSGEVGSGGGWPLIDGGSIYIPNYGAWAPDGSWVVEGHGALPDIRVDQDPALVMAGRDPQLDRAIQYLKDQIAKKPVERPVPPPFPIKAH